MSEQKALGFARITSAPLFLLRLGTLVQPTAECYLMRRRPRYHVAFAALWAHVHAWENWEWDETWAFDEKSVFVDPPLYLQTPPYAVGATLQKREQRIDPVREQRQT